MLFFESCGKADATLQILLMGGLPLFLWNSTRTALDMMGSQRGRAAAAGIVHDSSSSAEEISTFGVRSILLAVTVAAVVSFLGSRWAFTACLFAAIVEITNESWHAAMAFTVAGVELLAFSTIEWGVSNVVINLAILTAPLALTCVALAT